MKKSIFKKAAVFAAIVSVLFIGLVVFPSVPKAIAQSYGNLFSSLFAPINQTPDTATTSSLSTTLTAPLSADVPQANTRWTSQAIAMHLLKSHGDNGGLVCHTNIAYNGTTGADCAAKCANTANFGGSLPTCDGSSTDAEWVLPGTTAEIPLRADRCLCAMAEASSYKVQTVRLTR